MGYLLLVHGSPRKINEYLFEDRKDESMLRMMRKADTHLMAFGHTHKPYHKALKDEDARFRMRLPICFEMGVVKLLLKNGRSGENTTRTGCSSAFTTMFKTKAGRSPGEWRKQRFKKPKKKLKTL